MAIPKIGRALPKRRYQIGEYSAVLLGEIENVENFHFIYFLAMVKDGDREPSICISFEQEMASDADDQPYSINLYTKDQKQILAYSPQALSMDEFDKGALQTAMKILQLTDEKPCRLL